MAIRISLAGWALGACLGLAGCVSEPGKTGPALWTTVDTTSAESAVKLKHPVRLHTSYGRVAEANGRHSVARKHYETALTHDPKCLDAIVGMARIDQVAGRTRQAEQGFQKALALAPKNADVLQSAGLFYSSQGRYREAVASLNAAVAVAPNVAKHRYSLAAVLAKSGDLNAAMPHLVAAVGRAEAHSQMARFLLERGDRRGAEQQLQAALSADPNLDSARQLAARFRGGEQRSHVAAADPRPSQRGPVRAVSHVSPNDGYDDQPRRRQSPAEYQTPDREDPRDFGKSLGSAHDAQSLQIVPGTSRGEYQAPMIPPSRTGNDGRFQRPTRVDGDFENQPTGALPQWNPQGRNQ